MSKPDVGARDFCASCRHYSPRALCYDCHSRSVLITMTTTMRPHFLLCHHLPRPRPRLPGAPSTPRRTLTSTRHSLGPGPDTLKSVAVLGSTLSLSPSLPPSLSRPLLLSRILSFTLPSPPPAFAFTPLALSRPCPLPPLPSPLHASNCKLTG